MFRQLIQNNGYIHTQISVLIDDTYSRWYQLEGKTWEDFEGKTWLEVFSAELPIKEMTKKYDGSLYSTILQELEIKVEGKHDLKNEWLNVQIGVSESYKSATVYWHDWGDFLVRDVEYNEATDETTLLAYDKLILTHLEYNLDDLDVLYPLTAYQLVQAICSLVGLNLSGSFANDDIVITQDRFSNQGLAYRNVLDQIAEISGSVVRIENDELVIAQPTYYDTAIQEENLSELTIKGEVKQANILNLSREPQHDNYVFPLDWNEIPIDDRVEIVFADNQFVDYDRATYAESILDLLTYKYRLFEATSFGYGDIPVFAKVKVKDIENNEYDSYITSSEIKVTNDIREKISADEPRQLKDKYALLTDNERELIRTALIVDKQNGVIQGVVENIGDLEELTSEMLIDINGLEDTVKYLNKGNIIPNLNGANGYFGWIGLGEALFMDSQFMEDMTFGMSAYPVETTNSSGYGWNFYNNGEMISNYGFILDNTENYSFKAKIENYQTTQIKVYEYDDEYDLINTTTKNLTLGNYQFTMSLDENTQYVKLGFLVNASYANQVLLTDMMFNQGQPKDYYATSDEAMLYAMTSRKQINNEIVDTVEEISKVDGKINNTTVQITAKDGVVIHNNNGKGLTILNDNGEKVIELDSSGNVISRQMTTIDMVAKNIKAETGKIGRFNLDDLALVYQSPEYLYEYGWEDLAVIRNIIMREIYGGASEPTPFELYLYDFNGNGRVEAADYILLKRMLSGLQPMAEKLISSIIKIGEINGEIISYHQTPNGHISESLLIKGRKLQTPLANIESLRTNQLFVGQEEVRDFVIGTASDYRKHSDGTLEVWGVETKTLNVSTNWNGRAFYGNFGNINIEPFVDELNFSSKPLVTMNVFGNYDVWHTAREVTTTQIKTIYILTAEAMNNVTVEVHWRALGRWD